MAKFRQVWSHCVVGQTFWTKLWSWSCSEYSSTHHPHSLVYLLSANSDGGSEVSKVKHVQRSECQFSMKPEIKVGLKMENSNSSSFSQLKIDGNIGPFTASFSSFLLSLVLLTLADCSVKSADAWIWTRPPGIRMTNVVYELHWYNEWILSCGAYKRPSFF